MAVTSLLIAAIAGTGFAWRQYGKLLKAPEIKMDQKFELFEKLEAIRWQEMDLWQLKIGHSLQIMDQKIDLWPQRIDQSHQQIDHSLQIMDQKIDLWPQRIDHSHQQIDHWLQKMEIYEQMNAVKWGKMEQLIIQLRSDNAVLMKFVHDKLNGVGMTDATNSNQQQRLENQPPAEPTILGLKDDLAEETAKNNKDLATEIKVDSKGDQKRRLENIFPPEPPILHSGLPFGLVIKLVDFRKMASFLIRKLPK